MTRRVNHVVVMLMLDYFKHEHAIALDHYEAAESRCRYMLDTYRNQYLHGYTIDEYLKKVDCAIIESALAYLDVDQIASTIESMRILLDPPGEPAA